ncbi:MAG: hypothetical protein IKS83_03225, partial [Victivallales bacterium]|nr:hypothetical protein [Victivallales bacterium]
MQKLRCKEKLGWKMKNCPAGGAGQLSMEIYEEEWPDCLSGILAMMWAIGFRVGRIARSGGLRRSRLLHMAWPSLFGRLRMAWLLYMSRPSLFGRLLHMSRFWGLHMSRLSRFWGLLHMSRLSRFWG